MTPTDADRETAHEIADKNLTPSAHQAFRDRLINGIALALALAAERAKSEARIAELERDLAEARNMKVGEAYAQHLSMALKRKEPSHD